MTKTRLYKFFVRILSGDSDTDIPGIEAQHDSLSEDEFQELAKRWKAEERFTSLSSQVAVNPAYLRIIAMGKQALPFIFEDLAKQPDLWFAALRAITGEDPVPEESKGDMERSASLWLEWGRKRNYI